MWPQAKERLKLEGQEEPRIFKPSEAVGAADTLGLDILGLEVQNYDRIHPCCFKPSSWW